MVHILKVVLLIVNRPFDMIGYTSVWQIIKGGKNDDKEIHIKRRFLNGSYVNNSYCSCDQCCG